jgi:FemAB-related protein (PEP-CTERM system-associated)
MAWTLAVQNAYGFKSVNLLAEENNRVSGVFPLTLLKPPFKKPELVALPYCDIGTILSTDHQSRTELFKAAISTAKNNMASMINIRGGIDNELLQNCDYPLQSTNAKVRMLLDLPGSAGELWDGFKSKLRSQVRKVEKNGLTFQFANERIDDFYTVFSQNMRDLGSPVHSKKWFEEIIKQFADNAKLGLVYHEGQAIGTGIILRAGNKISIPWASTLREFNRLAPNMLLYWKFLEYAADNKCTTFDFGRSTPDEGTYKFKAQWGAEPTALPWHKIFLKGTPGPDASEPSKSRELIASIWQKLPKNLANYLGPKIRKYISL